MSAVVAAAKIAFNAASGTYLEALVRPDDLLVANALRRHSHDRRIGSLASTAGLPRYERRHPRPRRRHMPCEAEAV
ncbi:hypothetical protein [Nocardia sp. NPDC049707]|uniref:hypothetical protein n=1 Tax=Nocardia sp. NPDC049707 TaxID=3154735 RepID=UPI003412D99E